MKKSNIKSLCIAMAAAMTVSSITPAFSANAADKAKFDKTYKKVRQDVGTYNYNLTGLKKNYKVKWTIEDGSKNVITNGVSLENQGKKVTAGGTSLTNKLTIEDISSLDAGLKAKTKYYVVAKVYVKNTKTKKYEFSYKVKDRIYFFADAEDVILSVKENTISNNTIETKVGSMLDFDATQKPKNATTNVYYSAKNASGQAIELKKGVSGSALTYDGSGKITFNEVGEFDITVETKRSDDSKVTSSQTVKVIVKEIESQIEKPTPEITETVKQTGIQTITLTTKENINVASAASIISVKKGSSTVNLDSSNPFIVDGNTVYIKTASRMTAGDYTVTVNGKSLSFKAEDEKVDKIEILNDKLVVNKSINTNNSYTKGTVYYHVLNQFAEDMTRRAQITANSSNFTINSSTSTVTYEQSSGIRIGDKIALTLINTTTGKSDSKILTVSAQANVAELEVADIQGNKSYVYNKDKKTLTEDTDLDVDKFYILFTAKDQYENVLNPLDKNGRDTVSDGILFSIPGLTNLDIKPISSTNNSTDVTQIEVNGKNYFAVQLTKKDKNKSLTAGTDNTLMICKGSGKNITTPITVNAGSKVATITISAPDVVIAGQPATFEFTALDTNGNDVSSKLAGYYTRTTNAYTGAQNTKETGKDSNNAMTTIPDDFVFEKNYNTNKVELKYYSSHSNTDRQQYVTFVTATNQVVNVQFTVKASSKPTTITKIASDKLTTVNLVNQSLEIKQEDITIEDQYGKVMSNDELKKNADNYKYVVKIDGVNDIFSIATGSAIGNNESVFIKDTNHTIIKATVKPDVNDTKNAKIGNARISIELQDKDGKNISGSIYSFTIQSVDYTKAFNSYSVDNIGTLYSKSYNYQSGDEDGDNNDGYGRKVIVKGIMSNGTNVTLPKSLYSVQGNDSRILYNPTYNTIYASANAINSTSYESYYGSSTAKSKDTSITVTIGHSGKTISKNVTVSRDDTTINTINVRDGEYVKWYPSDNASGKLSITNQISSKEAVGSLLGEFEAFDQYQSMAAKTYATSISGGAFYTAIDNIKQATTITLSDMDFANSDVGVNNNGTENFEFKSGTYCVGDSFTATIKSGNATRKVKVIIMEGFTITQSNPEISNEIKIRFHYLRKDGNYKGWNLFTWPNSDSTSYYFDESNTDEKGSVCTFTVPTGTTNLGFIVRLSNDTNDWAAKDPDGDRFIDLSSVISGTVDIYANSGVTEFDTVLGDDVVKKAISNAKFDDTLQNIDFVLTSEFKDDPKSAISVIDSQDNKIEIDDISINGLNGTIKLKEKVNGIRKYFILLNSVKFDVNINTSDIFSSKPFEDEFTYTGNDLGATWSKEKTNFRVWAPTATNVKINLYESGDASKNDLIETIDMKSDVNGTWITEKIGDLNGTYYTYTATVNGSENEACDPYAKTTGVNGDRAMIIDLSSTNPSNWDNDKRPNTNLSITDAIIYELHVRDLSSSTSSGIKNSGKYLGLTEKGTKNSKGISTGLDHMLDLGITHLHLNPVYDYATVDETKLNESQFNWGYDPKNYNVPDGSYSTDPYNGAVRVNEFKQMVQTLHENNISVIMDVVYNHTYNAKDFCFDKLVPDYFYRIKEDGSYSNGSGCGNDVASERSMVSKYIVDSIVYWAKEYHIDGFRFDLVGLIDTDTINAIRTELDKIDPSIILYGEGWAMGTFTTKEDVDLATQTNVSKLKGFAMFNDVIRDNLKGSVFDAADKGYVNGNLDKTDAVKNDVMGITSWSTSPTQLINYTSCHDNLTLWDKINSSNADDSLEDRVKQNLLAASIVYTSQGTPFILAGEEMLRSKPNADGTFNNNSYNAPDSVNSIKWDNLNDETYQKVYNYYKGLIQFRKAHSALRMTENTKDYIHFSDNVTKGAIAYSIDKVNGETSDGIFVIYNPLKTEIKVTLPDGNWNVCIKDDIAGAETLETVSGGAVTVSAISCMVLTK